MTHAALPEPPRAVTLVFTDIQGSSALWEEHGDAFRLLLDEHNAMLRAEAARLRGVEVRHMGDGFFLSFGCAPDAVLFAVRAQLAIAARAWEVPDPASPGQRRRVDFLVRIGMHSGEAQELRHPTGALDYYGATPNRAARVGAVGHGGQVVVSEATRLLAQPHLPPEVSWRDLGRHGLKGMGEERLWQVGHPGLVAEFSPLATPGRPGHNLPTPSAPFIGRQELLRECDALLRQPATRLVTLTGFGGFGKTRTACEVARGCLDAFPDGVWWVPLERARSEDEVVARIAEALRLCPEPQANVRELLWNFLRKRALLLLLDNMEQVPPEPAACVLHGLLEASEASKYLVTSRRSLNIASEHLIELGSLALPEAQSLFVERARARRPRFAPDGASLAEVAEVCRQLEGVPLAIEIAASLTGVLSPRQMLGRLDDRLRWLAARDPSRPERQQGLRTAIDWSYELLSEEHRALFANLSVFAGGFTVEAAEAVAAEAMASHGLGTDALSGLLELRDQSILRVDEDSYGIAERLSMLEVVRRYAAEKLGGSPSLAPAQERHAAYFCALAEEKTRLLGTREEAAALDELEAEFDNLRAALAWAQSHDAQSCAKIALHFHQCLQARGLWDEAGRCLEAGWEACKYLGEAGRALRAALRFQMSSLAHDVGGSDAARAHVEAVLPEFRGLHDDAGSAGCLNLLGLLETETGQLLAAHELFEQALRLWPQSSLEGCGGTGKTLHNMARLAALSGDEAAARDLYEQSLAWRRRAGDVRGEARTLGNLGALARARGDLQVAEKLYRESLALRRTLREPSGIAIMLNNLGDLALEREDWPRALAFLAHSEKMLRELGSPLAEEPARAIEEWSRDHASAAPHIREQAAASAWETLL